MTLRAVLFGLLLALVVAGGSYFNDSVVRQVYLTGNFLPPFAFGVAVLLGMFGLSRTRQRITPGEIAVVAALALAGGAWAGNSFGRSFSSVISLPWHWEGVQSGWLATNATSYLPNGSPRVAEGQIADWAALGRAVAERPELAAVRAALPTSVAASLEKGGELGSTDRTRVLLAINGFIMRGSGNDSPGAAVAAQRERRALVERAAEGAVRAAPAGNGLLLPYADGTLSAVEGRVTARGDVPWSVWWGALRVWLPLMLCFGLATFCLALIVHPQWAERERLPYPIARFLEPLLRRDGAFAGEGGAFGLPKLFWWGFLGVLLLHAVNGLHAVFPALPSIPLTFDLSALKVALPNAAKVGDADFVLFTPTLYPSVIALATLIAGRVALSMGVASYLWILLSVVAMSRGVLLGEGGRTGGGPRNMLMCGAFLGLAGMLLFVGRRYYGQVAVAAVRGSSGAEVPAYAVWAARGLPLFTGGMIASLVFAGVEWHFAAATAVGLLVMYLVLTRIVVETGALYVQADWTVLGVLVGLLGYPAVGPTNFFLLMILSMVLSVDVRDNLMPHLQHALFLVSRNAGGGGEGAGGSSGVPRLAPLIGVVVVAALLVTTFGSIAMSYRYGVNMDDAWPNVIMPSLPFWIGTGELSDAAAVGQLGTIVGTTGLDRLALAEPSATSAAWLAAGVGLVVFTAWGRLRFPAWPLHPVAFLVWGTTGAAVFSASFLLGWAIKEATVRFTGAKGYESLRPVAVGVISGELIGALLWMMQGAVYFTVSGMRPTEYRIFPG